MARNKGSTQVRSEGNTVVGLFWAFFCIGILLTIPMAILCVCELSLWARADRMPLQTFGRQVRLIGVFEIVLGLANLPTLICGIINVVNGMRLANEDEY